LGVFNKILNVPLQGIKKYINYKDKSMTVKTDLLNSVSDYIPKLKVIAPVIKAWMLKKTRACTMHGILN